MFMGGANEGGGRAMTENVGSVWARLSSAPFGTNK
jgi:hypothetical protein